jgi:hypothetical protein
MKLHLALQISSRIPEVELQTSRKLCTSLGLYPRLKLRSLIADPNVDCSTVRKLDHQPAQRANGLGL